MWQIAQLVFSSYIPKKLEKGMYFLKRENNQIIECFELTHIPRNIEEFITENGYPVNLKILNFDNQIIADEHLISWFDEGDDSDEIHTLTIKDINNIIDNQGLIEIELNEDGTPLQYLDKITIKLLEI